MPDIYINNVEMIRAKGESRRSPTRFFGCGAVEGREGGQYLCRMYRWGEEGSIEDEWDNEKLPSGQYGEEVATAASRSGELWGALVWENRETMRLLVGRFPEYVPFGQFSVERDMSAPPLAFSSDVRNFIFLDEDASALTVAIAWGGFVDILGEGPNPRRADPAVEPRRRRRSL